MDSTTYTALREDALMALRHGHLYRAFEVMTSLAEQLRECDVNSRLFNIRDAYNRLLNYFVEGAQDPERQSMIDQFVSSSYELMNVLHHSFLIQQGSTHFSGVYATLRRMGIATRLAEISLMECTPRVLFESAWTSPIWQQTDYDIAVDLLSQAALSAEECYVRRPLLLSGTLLALTYFFDPLRLQLLLTAAESEDVTLRARALVGICLTYLRYNERIERYPKLIAQTNLLMDRPDIRKALLTIQFQLLLTLDSKSIERSLREEILPEMMKQVRKARRKGSAINITGNENDLLNELSINPEWDENGKPSSFGRKVRELHEMHLKGADIFMGSFKMLKQNFPFFSVAANWFYPFTTNHPDLKGAPQFSGHVGRLMHQGMLCDSDRYSMSLILSQMALSQGDNFNHQLREALSQLPEEAPEKETGQQLPDAQLSDALRICIQDLHRFFKLFRYRDEGIDPFNGELLLTNCKPFDRLLSDTEVVEQLADFTFEEKHYTYALDYLRRLSPTAAHWQKIGYARQMSGDLQAAISSYERALLIDEHSHWTQRQLAGCLRTSGQYEQAIAYYQRLEESASQPEAHTLLLLSDCYLRTAQYEAALEKLFKADYLFPDDAQTMRALAWCSLLVGKYEQAERYYSKIVVQSPTAEDWMNRGHNAWLSGQPKVAVEYYMHSLQRTHAAVVPMDFFADDSEVLRQRGIPSDEQSLMLDFLSSRYAAQSAGNVG